MTKLAPNILTFINEDMHSVFSIYKNKIKHYIHYDCIYEMAFLDVNENRGRKMIYQYKANM